MSLANAFEFENLIESCPERASHISPGQSEAPPWVTDPHFIEALKGRYK
jgi:hypothetical protein